MEATELRIGNYILDEENEVRQVTELSRTLIRTSCDRILLTLQAKPIPLTEEILVKCGFENEYDEIDGVYYDIYYVPNTDYVVEYKLETKQYLFLFYFDNSSGIGVEIKYLHQLQNLYFALTGEELEVNLQVKTNDNKKEPTAPYDEWFKKLKDV